jgi:hypothetical protein
MSRVRVVGAMRVHGAFSVRQLARGNIGVASTAVGVTEKQTSDGLQLKIQKREVKKTYTPDSCEWEERSDSSISSMSFSEGPPRTMFPAPPRPVVCVRGSRDRERDFEPRGEPDMLPAPPRPNDVYRKRFNLTRSLSVVTNMSLTRPVLWASSMLAIVSRS